MLGWLIYSHSHLDDVRILQEIIKNVFAKEFEGVYVVHCYNGQKSYGYQKYLEDKLIKMPNRGHIKGCADHINAGLHYFNEHHKKIKYVIITAADTWLFYPEFIKEIIFDMNYNKQVIAASSWVSQYPVLPKGLSTDFFIMNMEWNRKSRLFPFSFDEFSSKFKDVCYLNWGIPILEMAVQYYYQKYFAEHFDGLKAISEAQGKLRRIIEREPVHNEYGIRKENWHHLGLYTTNNTEEKQKKIQKLNYDFGYYSHKLISSQDLSYYNNFR